jgi:hypothetical protein
MNRTEVFRYVCNEIVTGHIKATTCIIERVQREGWKRIHRARRIARRLDFDTRSLPQL